MSFHTYSGTCSGGMVNWTHQDGYIALCFIGDMCNTCAFVGLFTCNKINEHIRYLNTVANAVVHGRWVLKSTRYNLCVY